MLAALPLALRRTKGEIEQQDIEAEEARHRPGAGQRERHAHGDADAGHTQHQDDKAGPPERPVGVEHGLERPARRIASSWRGPSASRSREHICREISHRQAARRGRRPVTLLRADEIEALFTRLAAANPTPRTELLYQDPFSLLVAVVLSAQATDVGVNKATKALFAAAPTPAAMVALGEEGVREHIQTIGLYRNKAKNVRGAEPSCCSSGTAGRCRPSGRRSRPCPGSAARPPTSCSTRRSARRRSRSTRTSSASPTAPAWRRGARPRRWRQPCSSVVPDRFRRGAHHWLILHGRYVCLARRPTCPACVRARHLPLPGQDAQPSQRSRARSERVVAADHARGRERAAGQAPLGGQHPPGQHRLGLRQHRSRVARIACQIVQPGRIVRRCRSTRPAGRRSGHRRGGRRTVSPARRHRWAAPGRARRRPATTSRKSCSQCVARRHGRSGWPVRKSDRASPSH